MESYNNGGELLWITLPKGEFLRAAQYFRDLQQYQRFLIFRPKISKNWSLHGLAVLFRKSTIMFHGRYSKDFHSWFYGLKQLTIPRLWNSLETIGELGWKSCRGFIGQIQAAKAFGVTTATWGFWNYTRIISSLYTLSIKQAAWWRILPKANTYLGKVLLLRN